MRKQSKKPIYLEIKKKEYERGWNEAMVCKKGTKRLCSECRKAL